MTGVADLGLTDIVASQNQKEVTANANFEVLASAITAAFDANVTSGNVTLTNAQYQKAALIRATNATTAGRTVTLPAKARVTILLNPSTNTQSVDFVRGSATVTLVVGEAAVVRTDGTTNGLFALMRGAAASFALTDGDKGDITVGSSGTSFTIDTGAVTAGKIGASAVTTAKIAALAVTATEIANGAVTLAKMANLATDTLVGRATAGTGVPEAITLTAAGRALLDDVDAAAQRATLGLPSSVTVLNNGTATTDPTTGDDSADGYSVGSMWFNRSRRTIWLCTDATLGAAVWEPFLSRKALHGGYGSAANEVAATGGLNAASAAGVAVANRLYLRPFQWFGGRSIVQLFGRVTAVGTTSNIKFGLWGHDYNSSRPTGLPLAANNTPIGTTTTGIKQATVSSVDPPPGILWVASIQEGATTPGMQAASAGNFEAWLLTVLPGQNFDLLVGAANQGTYGAYTDDFTFAGDITTFDLTAATFLRSGGNAATHPHVMLGF